LFIERLPSALPVLVQPATAIAMQTIETIDLFMLSFDSPLRKRGILP
jgi:hypothetical protein